MTIAYVQEAKAYTNTLNATTVVATLANTPANGDILVLLIGFANSGGVGISISTDGSGVNWDSGYMENTYINSYLNQSIWIYKAIVSGSSAGKNTTVTFTPALYTGQIVIINIIEFSGLPSANLDVHTHNTNSSTTGDTGQTGQSGQANELWIGGLFGYAHNHANGQSGQTSGWTLYDGSCYTGTNDGTRDYSLATVYKIVSSQGQAECTDTFAYSSAFAGVIVTIKNINTYVKTFTDKVGAMDTPATQMIKLKRVRANATTTGTFYGTQCNVGAKDSFSKTELYRLKGVTRDSNNNVLGNCIVVLYKSSDNTLVSGNVEFPNPTTSDGSGNFTFYVTDKTTAYYVWAQKDGSPDVWGCTDNTLVGGA